MTYQATDLSVFGRSRDPVKVSKLKPSGKRRLNEADQRCLDALNVYLAALQAKGQLELEYDLITTRDNSKVPPKERRR